MIGAQARAARAQLGLSQDEVAELTGVGVSTYKHIENDTGDPRRSRIQKVREFYESAGFKFVNDAGVIGLPPPTPHGGWTPAKSLPPDENKDGS